MRIGTTGASPRIARSLGAGPGQGDDGGGAADPESSLTSLPGAQLGMGYEYGRRCSFFWARSADPALAPTLPLWALGNADTAFRLGPWL